MRYFGYFIHTNCTTHGKVVISKLFVQLKDDHLIGQGCDKNRKGAKAKASLVC
ncbi:putative CCR4-associated factor 1-like protein 7 [Iris pallida]|uniref:CCR4-associated factor 1-like protein 7 n=1 Tax=Iris pallida TaxID=29817 RepID=A0AAX6G1V4_IRIPA|nr:putative CCR4-associated factor 1-like protein 7 [Iris pallida]